ncbi:MAG: ribulose-phosphate 3-epimerase [Rariglobus sp.]|jgi:ribulose-phosphate 3-epimerase|nr:ribulose-phosphate 3-epimerase [Rariglobus sp.]
MNIQLGLKTDCIETRYSFPWLFDLLAEEGIPNIQLGSFYELYALDDTYFTELRREAESRGLRIKSVFTAHRELGGFFVGDVRMERAARKGFERLLEVGVLVGADYVGSNPGAVYRDQPPAQKAAGTATYLRNLKELSRRAHRFGLKGLTMEPMSCLAEPPTTPEEMRHYIGEMRTDHAANPATTVPTYLCGDISHGLADINKQIIHSNTELFIAGIPMMNEFHFKNTDAIYGSTFGFNPEEKQKGIVDLVAFKTLCDRHADQWPVDDVVGYLEIMGPKIGRDYSDPHLGTELRTSLRAIKEVFA